MGAEHPDAEVAKASQKSQKEDKVEFNTFFIEFFRDFCGTFATSASGFRYFP
jgi:hypothetical protein